MSATVVQLPTAATTYLRVCRYGRQWCIDLVTPVEGGKPLTTRLGSSSSRTAAVDYATLAGKRMHRPVRLPGGAS